MTKDGNRPLPTTLTAYADTLLLGTDLTTNDVLQIARGERDLTGDLAPVAEALRAGWNATHAALPCQTPETSP